VPYISKWWSSEKQNKANYVVISKVFENSGYIIFQAFKQTTDYFGLFYKKEEKLFVNEFKSGLPNDVDNFIPFSPAFMDNDGNFIEIINPIKIVNWVKDNPLKLKDLPDKIQKLLTMREEENPIIMIGKTSSK
jgi:hypothetical protein